MFLPLPFSCSSFEDLFSVTYQSENNLPKFEFVKPAQELANLGSIPPSDKWRIAKRVLYRFSRSKSMLLRFVFGTIPLKIRCTISLIPTWVLVRVPKVWACMRRCMFICKFGKLLKSAKTYYDIVNKKCCH